MFRPDFPRVSSPEHKNSVPGADLGSSCFVQEDKEIFYPVLSAFLNPFHKNALKIKYRVVIFPGSGIEGMISIVALQPRRRKDLDSDLSQRLLEY